MDSCHDDGINRIMEELGQMTAVPSQGLRSIVAVKKQTMCP